MGSSRLLSLPPELLIRITEELKTDNYSAKERQADLARMARVHPAFHAVAQSMLYGGEVTARSAGRTHLLARSLDSNRSLSDAIRTLSFRSEMDTGHAESLIKILRCCRSLRHLALSAVYLRNTPLDLYIELQTHSHLQSFSYGYHGVESPLEDIVPLLSSFPHLKNLTLDRVAAVPRGHSPVSALVKRELHRWGPPPPYHLETLTISNWKSIDTAGWPLELLRWLIGATSSGLRSLQLIDFVGVTPLSSIFDLLVERKCHGTLERLAIRDYQDGLSPESTPLDPNSLSDTFPNLSHLSLMTNADETSFRSPCPHFILPPRLRFLQLDDDLFLTWRLLETVQAGTVPRTLRHVRLRGPFPSDVDVKALRRACSEKMIWCEVVRAF
ncbi:hypothetical protein JCM11491_001935 [Sporobolomyces phaffii]